MIPGVPVGSGRYEGAGGPGKGNQEMAEPVQRNIVVRFLIWYSSWAIPGLGMFSEAYIIFSAGQIKIFQEVMWPSCWQFYIDCQSNMINHLSGYIQICGIMAGMLLWGALGDIVGRKWGSRCVAMIMLSGCILLTFSPYAPTAYGYFCYFMVAQTWYGFGVGGEYPMASSSAAELAEVKPELFSLRGRQVVLVFSGQGMGNFVNAIIICICMAIFGQTGACGFQKTWAAQEAAGLAAKCPGMTVQGSKDVLILMYGMGAIFCLFMVVYRLVWLKESEFFETSQKFEAEVLNSAAERRLKWMRFLIQIKWYLPRLIVGSVAWICNDFAFYGNKLCQGIFITILYPTATPYKKQQWTILNNFIALTGYYFAAWLVDKPWYGRMRMQTIGFAWMFVLYIICYAIYNDVTATYPVVPPSTIAKAKNPGGMQAFQFLYYFSSFWNQFGPNCTTWLVAGEMFPTDCRTTYHGFCACMGKLGAIISALWFSYVSNRVIFLLSALWAIGGMAVTIVFMADTTLLNLTENERLNQKILLGKFEEYHGEAVNPIHLSLWERWFGWSKNYNPELDQQQHDEELNVKA